MKLPAQTRSTFLKSSASFAAVAAATPAQAANATTTLRLSIPTGLPDPLAQTGQRYAQIVSRRTNGQLEIQPFYNGSLANQQASVDGMITGSVDMNLSTTAYLEGLVPSVQILDMPFLFADRASAQRVIDSDIGAQLARDVAAKGIIVLAFGTAGWREMSTTKPVLKMADMNGLRMRIQNGPVYVTMMKALGSVPVVIDNTEVFPALQQRTVDGLEQPLPTVYSSKLYTAIRYVALTNHLYNASPLMISKQRYDALPKEFQTALYDAARELLPYWRAMYVKADSDAIAALKDKGVSVAEVDLAPFKHAMAPVYADYRPKIGATIFDRASKMAST